MPFHPFAFGDDGAHHLHARSDRELWPNHHIFAVDPLKIVQVQWDGFHSDHGLAGPGFGSRDGLKSEGFLGVGTPFVDPPRPHLVGQGCFLRHFDLDGSVARRRWVPIWLWIRREAKRFLEVNDSVPESGNHSDTIVGVFPLPFSGLRGSRVR